MSVLNGKRGLPRVGLSLVVGPWRVPWSFRVWRGKGHASPVRLACQLWATVPTQLSRGKVVIVQAETAFGTIEFLQAVRKRSWRAVVEMRCTRKLSDGRALKPLYRHGNRGQQVQLEEMSDPLTVAWFWLKRSQGKRALRFVVSTHPYSGVYLVRWGRKRWTIEGVSKRSNLALGCLVSVKPPSLESTVGCSCLCLPSSWLMGLTHGHYHPFQTGKGQVI